MANIEIVTEGELLIVNVKGELSAVEAIAVINKHYPSGNIKDVIWDMTEGSMLSISRDGLSLVAHAAKVAVANGARKGGRTVFVANRESEYGMARMYSIISEIAGVPVDYHVYKNLEDARHWLKQSV